MYINLLDIYYYIAYKLNSHITAVRNVENMINKIDSLTYFPHRGASYSDIHHRFIIYKNFLIFYKIQEKEKQIIILRIIHRNINMLQ